MSCDPLYGADASQIRQRIQATFDEMLDQTRRNANELVWDTIICDVSIDTVPYEFQRGGNQMMRIRG